MDMMEIMEINPLNDQLMEVWLSFRHRLWPYHTLEELKHEMTTTIDTPHYGVFFCKNNSSYVGFIEVSIKENIEFSSISPIGYIEGWYVDEQYRKLGIGRLLMHTAETWVASKSITWIASDTTLEYNLSPIAHKKLGFTESSIPLHYLKSIQID
jgi:aminoglycoside 6'-N-acetyltransferase I